MKEKKLLHFYGAFMVLLLLVLGEKSNSSLELKRKAAFQGQLTFMS